MSSAEYKHDKWPSLSHESLPPISKYVSERFENGDEMEFPVLDECTSLAVVPSGRHIVAGFTDGTLRLFDMTGKFHTSFSNDDESEISSRNSHNGEEFLFESDSSSDEEIGDNFQEKAYRNTRVVCSKWHQQHGAVACQIHAKGVHTSLQMTVAVSPDGLYAFGGVARGSKEMVAVNLGAVEIHVDNAHKKATNILDLLEVFRHSDAKLRGFGACTRLQSDYSRDTTYILLTGKGIKNIHIWSFVPAREEWMCLYDTQTNGNSISILHFRYTPEHNFLQAVSKSDEQKVRVWDLSYEQHLGNEKSIYYKPSPKGISTNIRPKRPHYHDVSSSESTLAVGGDILFGGSYQQVSLINLNLDAPYHSTEIGLPPDNRHQRVGRRQRGQLKLLTQVAAMTMGASHALFELSDGSIVHYIHDAAHKKAFETLSRRRIDGETNCSTCCVARIGSEGIPIAILASSRKLVVHKIGNSSRKGYWGFHGISHLVERQATILLPKEISVKETSGMQEIEVRTNQEISEEFSKREKMKCSREQNRKSEGRGNCSISKKLTTPEKVKARERHQLRNTPPSNTAISIKISPDNNTKQKKTLSGAWDLKTHEEVSAIVSSKSYEQPLMRNSEPSPCPATPNQFVEKPKNTVTTSLQYGASIRSFKLKNGRSSSHVQCNLVSNINFDQKVENKSEAALKVVSPVKTVTLPPTGKVDSAMAQETKKTRLKQISIINAAAIQRKKAVSVNNKKLIQIPVSNPREKLESEQKVKETPTQVSKHRKMVDVQNRRRGTLLSLKRKGTAAVEKTTVSTIQNPKIMTSSATLQERKGTNTMNRELVSFSSLKSEEWTECSELKEEHNPMNGLRSFKRPRQVIISQEMPSEGASSFKNDRTNLKKNAVVEDTRIAKKVGLDSPLGSFIKAEIECGCTNVEKTPGVFIKLKDERMKRYETKSEQKRITCDSHEALTSNLHLVTEAVTTEIEFVKATKLQKINNFSSATASKEPSPLTTEIKPLCSSFPSNNKTPGINKSYQSSLSEERKIKVRKGQENTLKIRKPQDKSFLRKNDFENDKASNFKKSLNRRLNFRSKLTNISDFHRPQTKQQKIGKKTNVEEFSVIKSKGNIVDAGYRSKVGTFNERETMIAKLPLYRDWSLPSASVARRIGTLPSKISNSECYRIRMFLEHRAEHETLRKRILESVTRLIRHAGDFEAGVDEIKKSFEESMDSYKSILDELIFRQELESSALAATSNLSVTPAVSFPFPEIFEQAREALYIALEKSAI